MSLGIPIIDINPSDSLSRVRLKIGDSSTDLISDGTIRGILRDNNDNVNLSVLESLRLIVAHLAKFVDEDNDGVELFSSQLYEQYSNLLQRYSSDPTFITGSIPIPILGGTSRTEARRVIESRDSRNTGIHQGKYRPDRGDLLSDRTSSLLDEDRFNTVLDHYQYDNDDYC